MAYDVVVIGSGPGGYSAAVRAGQYGLKTALIEKQARLGGTCLLVGCISTKVLLHTADVWDHFKDPEADGIECKDPRLNYPKVVDRKNKIIGKHSKGVEFLMRKNKVDVIKGSARLQGGGRIEVTGENQSRNSRDGGWHLSRRGDLWDWWGCQNIEPPDYLQLSARASELVSKTFTREPRTSLVTATQESTNFLYRCGQWIQTKRAEGSGSRL